MFLLPCKFVTVFCFLSHDFSSLMKRATLHTILIFSMIFETKGREVFCLEHQKGATAVPSSLTRRTVHPAALLFFSVFRFGTLATQRIFRNSYPLFVRIHIKKRKKVKHNFNLIKITYLRTRCLSTGSNPLPFSSVLLPPFPHHRIALKQSHSFEGPPDQSQAIRPLFTLFIKLDYFNFVERNDKKQIREKRRKHPRHHL